MTDKNPELLGLQKRIGGTNENVLLYPLGEELTTNTSNLLEAARKKILSQQLSSSNSSDSSNPSGSSDINLKFPVGNEKLRKSLKENNIGENNIEENNIEENNIGYFSQKLDALSVQVNNNRVPNPHLFSILTQENIIEELAPLWENIDFEEFPIEGEIDAFKSHAISALEEINIFLYQAQNNADWENKDRAFQEKLYSDIDKNVRYIWEKNMEGMFNGENISLEYFFKEMLKAKIFKAADAMRIALESENNGYDTDEYKNFINKQYSEEEWNKMREEYIKGKQKNLQQAENEKIKAKEYRGKIISSYEKTNNKPFPPTAQLNDYVDAHANLILSEATPEGEFSYLFQEGMKDDFVEVIQFLNGSIQKISPQAYRAMVALLKDAKRKNEREKWVNRNIKKVMTHYEKYQKKKKPDRDNSDPKYIDIQGRIMHSDELYQLGMMRLAERAKIKMMENSENGDVSQFLSMNDSSENIQKFITDTNNGVGVIDGYIVKNQHTDRADSSSDTQLAGRITPEFFLLDKVIGTGGIFVAIANTVMAFATGNWGAAAPYIAGGWGANYLMYKGLFNSGLSKVMHPEKMLNNIVQESFANEHYPEYFGNAWEVALAKSIKWPAGKGKGMKTDLKLIKKEREKRFEKEEGKLSFPQKDLRKERTEKVENISVDFFRNNNSEKNNQNSQKGLLSKYLPQAHILGPDGVLYKKDKFLDLVQANEQSTGMNAHIRYEMMGRISKRVGKKDSYIPLFDQLLQHYTQERSVKKYEK